jgi:phytoene dehydrogenase-like protein
VAAADVFVVGAGNNGLVAATYLAQASLDVLVVGAGVHGHHAAKTTRKAFPAEDRHDVIGRIAPAPRTRQR